MQEVSAARAQRWMPGRNEGSTLSAETCSTQKCTSPIHCRGLCMRCYQRIRRGLESTPPRPIDSVDDTLVVGIVFSAQTVRAIDRIANTSRSEWIRGVVAEHLKKLSAKKSAKKSHPHPERFR